jgi:hypothetical protein
VSTDPSPKARSMDLVSVLQHDRNVRVAYWIGMLIGAVVLMVWWFARGPGHPVFAMIVIIWTAVLTPGVAVPVLLCLPHRWCRVPAGERVLHRLLGVGIFAWLLERSGWNRRNVYPAWGSAITRARLPLRVLAARGGGGAHGVCFAIHVLLAAVALFTGHPWGALWILLPGVVVHLYPVLLQRSILLRLQPLLDKSGSRKFDVVRAGDKMTAVQSPASRIDESAPNKALHPIENR